MLSIKFYCQIYFTKMLFILHIPGPVCISSYFIRRTKKKKFDRQHPLTDREYHYFFSLSLFCRYFFFIKFLIVPLIACCCRYLLMVHKSIYNVFKKVLLVIYYLLSYHFNYCNASK